MNNIIAPTSSIQPVAPTRPSHPPLSSNSVGTTMDTHYPEPSSTSTFTPPLSSPDPSNGYIYVVLLFALLITLIFFARVALARRKERLRALKDPDYESMFYFLVSILPSGLKQLWIFCLRPHHFGFCHTLLISFIPLNYY